MTLSFSCSQKEEATEAPVGRVEVSTGGATKFGPVALDETKNVLIVVTNNSGSDRRVGVYRKSGVSLFENGLNGFSVSEDPNNSCLYIQTLTKGSSCNMTINFTAIEEGSFSDTFVIADQEISVSGQGVKNASMTLSHYLWDGGSLEAGEIAYKTFRILNTGLTSLKSPEFNSSLFDINFSNCPAYLFPGEECDIELKYLDVKSGFKRTDLEFISSEGVVETVFFQVEIRPGIPSGQILFENVPEVINAGSNVEHYVRAKIYDQFSNPVANGIEVEISTENITLIGPSVKTTQNGLIEFGLRPTNNALDIRVSLGSGQATGDFARPSNPGVPVGEVSFPVFNSKLKASGNDKRIILSNIVRDSFGNAIKDGELFTLTVSSGPVLVCDISNNCSKQLTVGASGGQVQVIVKSETLAAPARVNLSSNRGSAQGIIDIETVPLEPSGDFLLITDHNSLYYLYTGQESPRGVIQADVGPITDENGNEVGEGFDVLITIQNADSLTPVVNQSLLNLTTGADSMVHFSIKGSGTGGVVRIIAESHGVQTAKNLWATRQQSINASDISFVKVYRGIHDESLSNVPYNPSRWNQVRYEGSRTLSNDENYLSDTTYIGEASKIVAENVENLNQNCFVSARENTFLGPCPGHDDLGTEMFFNNSPPYVFAANNSATRLTQDQTSLFGSENPFEDGVLGADFFYHELGDFYALIGAHRLIGQGLYPTNYTSFLGFPSATKSRFDNFVYQDFALESGLGGSGKTQFKITGSEDIYLLGGVDLTFTGSPLDGVRFYSGLKRLTYSRSGDLGDIADVDVQEDKSLKDYNAYLTANNFTSLLRAKTRPEISLAKAISTRSGNVYIVGGISESPEDEIRVQKNDEIWKLDTNSDQLTWQRVCPPAPDPDLGETEETIQSTFQCLQDPAPGVNISAFEALSYPITNYDMIYLDDNAFNKINLLKVPNELTDEEIFLEFYKGGPYKKYTEIEGDLVIEDNPVNSTLDAGSQAFVQILERGNLKMGNFNEQTGKFFYFEMGDNPAGSSSQIKMLQAPTGKKGYLMIEFSFGGVIDGGVQEFKLDLEGYAFVTSDVLNSSPSYGLNVYIYDFVGEKWEFLNSNNLSSSVASRGSPMSIDLDPQYVRGARSYILIGNSVNPSQVSGTSKEATLNLGQFNLSGLW